MIDVRVTTWATGTIVADVEPVNEEFPE